VKKPKAPLIMVVIGILAVLAGVFRTEIRQLFGFKEPVGVQTTGDASTKGANSPANTGNGNSTTINQGAQPAPEKKP
jgi:hypothetical protein